MVARAQHFLAGVTHSKFYESKMESNLEMHQEGYKSGFDWRKCCGTATKITTETCLHLYIIDVDQVSLLLYLS